MSVKIEKENKVHFKKYDQLQVLQIPVDISKLIPDTHLVRVVDRVVEEIDMAKLECFYKGGGSSSYHPKMLIKVWIYGYCERVYTSRRLAKAMRENVNFIWLSGNQHPSFKTLSNFRGARMQAMVDIVFKQVILVLLSSGHLSLDDIYLDGTKLEANANEHKRVWLKNLERYSAGVLARVEELLAGARALQDAEDKEHGPGDLPELGGGKSLQVTLDAKSVGEHLSRLQELVSAEADKEKAKALARLAGKLGKEQAKLEKYGRQRQDLAGRNSMSTTDKDATILKMKDGQLLPAYNVQHTTSNQYVVNYTIAQNAADSTTLPAHVDKLRELLGEILPRDGINLGADAGYGSEENYAYLEANGITPYVKYTSWFQEETGEHAKKLFHKDNWDHDEHSDSYKCPNGQSLPFLRLEKHATPSGYTKELKVYKSLGCEGCPLAAACKGDNDRRTISRSDAWEGYKVKVKALLGSEKGKEVRSRRATEVESVFGDIKFNMGYNRFLLRGKVKVGVEYGLLSMAHNLRKLHCEENGTWREYYAQRSAKKAAKQNKKG